MDGLSESVLDEDDIDDLISYLEEAPIRLAVFGEFSAGKTTVLNALIGEEILSVAVDPTTAVPTRIRYGREFNIFVDREDDTRLQLFDDDPPFWTRFVGRRDVLNTLQKQQSTIQDFLWTWTKEGERADEVTRVIIELPLDWLKGGLELVDTPGVNNEFVRHQGFTEQEAGEADIAVLLMDARQGGGKRTEFEFMNDVQQQVQRCIVAPNKMDLIPADEREEFLEYIRETALPKHWEGAVTPPVIGISALAALNPEDHDEPRLTDAFDNLQERLERVAEEQRGKLLLTRKGNPEKQLFARAKELEGDEKYDRAHRLYFDLLDILAAGDLDPTPAEEGIARCEENLTTQVDALDELNQRYNEAMSVAEDDPDTALEDLRAIRDAKSELRLEDGDLQGSIDKLQDRIEERDEARSRIRKAKTTVEQYRQNGKWIKAAEKAEDALDWIETAELSKDEEADLRAYVEKQIDDRDEWKERRRIAAEAAQDKAEKEPEEALNRLRAIYEEREVLDGSPLNLEEVIVSLEKRIDRREGARAEIEELVESVRDRREKEEYIQAAEEAGKIDSLIGPAEIPSDKAKDLRQFIRQTVKDRDDWAAERWKEVKEEIDTRMDDKRYLAARHLLEELEEVASFAQLEDETEQIVAHVKERDKAQQEYREAVREALETAEVLRKDRVEPEEGQTVERAIEEVRAMFQSVHGMSDLPYRQPIDDSGIFLTIDEKLGLALHLKILAELSPRAEDAARLAQDLRTRRREIRRSIVDEKKGQLALVEQYPDHPKTQAELDYLLHEPLPFWALPNQIRRARSILESNKPYLPQERVETRIDELEERASVFEWHGEDSAVAVALSLFTVVFVAIGFSSGNVGAGFAVGLLTLVGGGFIQYFRPGSAVEYSSDEKDRKDSNSRDQRTSEQKLSADKSKWSRKKADRCPHNFTEEGVCRNCGWRQEEIETEANNTTEEESKDQSQQSSSDEDESGGGGCVAVLRVILAFGGLILILKMCSA